MGTLECEVAQVSKVQLSLIHYAGPSHPDPPSSCPGSEFILNLPQCALELKKSSPFRRPLNLSSLTTKLQHVCGSSPRCDDLKVPPWGNAKCGMELPGRFESASYVIAERATVLIGVFVGSGPPEAQRSCKIHRLNVIEHRLLSNS
jgi:hypothetical protein